jgi:hypothetical protein
MVLLLRWPLHDGVRKTSEELSAQLCALLRRFEETKDALMAAWPAGSTPREGIRALAR